jgi:hypothetical protein
VYGWWVGDEVLFKSPVVTVREGIGDKEEEEVGEEVGEDVEKTKSVAGLKVQVGGPEHARSPAASPKTSPASASWTVLGTMQDKTPVTEASALDNQAAVPAAAASYRGFIWPWILSIVVANDQQRRRSRAQDGLMVGVGFAIGCVFTMMAASR